MANLLLLPEETWRDIPGYEGRYQITPAGKFRSLYKRNGGKAGPNGSRYIGIVTGGYESVHLTDRNRKTRFIKISRLVALTYIPNFHNKPQVNHIDSNRKNNTVQNLEWVTSKENFIHAKLNNRYKQGERHWNSKLKDSDVREIRKLHKEGTTKWQLAKMFNISRSSIIMIIRRQHWPHVI